MEVYHNSDIQTRCFHPASRLSQPPISVNRPTVFQYSVKRGASPPFDNDCKFTYCFTAHMHEIPKYFLSTENQEQCLYFPDSTSIGRRRFTETSEMGCLAVLLAGLRWLLLAALQSKPRDDCPRQLAAGSCRRYKPTSRALDEPHHRCRPCARVRRQCSTLAARRPCSRDGGVGPGR